MFYVKIKKPESLEESKTIKTVYGIQYKSGYPFFLFYEDGWIIRSAKYYEPIENRGLRTLIKPIDDAMNIFKEEKLMEDKL